MSKGLLAHWRRGIVGRGAAAAALLAIPVAVAGVIGFSGGFGSVTGGPLRADAPAPRRRWRRPPAGLDGAFARSWGRAGNSRPGDPEPDDPGDPAARRGTQRSDPTRPGQLRRAPTVERSRTPDVTVPGDDPNGSIDSIVDDVNRAVGGVNGTGRRRARRRIAPGCARASPSASPRACPGASRTSSAASRAANCPCSRCSPSARPPAWSSRSRSCRCSARIRSRPGRSPSRPAPERGRDRRPRRLLPRPGAGDDEHRRPDRGARGGRAGRRSA